MRRPDCRLAKSLGTEAASQIFYWHCRIHAGRAKKHTTETDSPRPANQPDHPMCLVAVRPEKKGCACDNSGFAGLASLKLGYR